MIPAYILGIAFWVAILYFLLGPWAAGLWCLCLIAFGWLVHSEVHKVEIQEPEPGELIDFEEALRCRGRLPRDTDYERAA